MSRDLTIQSRITCEQNNTESNPRFLCLSPSKINSVIIHTWAQNDIWTAWLQPAIPARDRVVWLIFHTLIYSALSIENEETHLREGDSFSGTVKTLVKTRREKTQSKFIQKVCPSSDIESNVMDNITGPNIFLSAFFVEILFSHISYMWEGNEPHTHNAAYGRETEKTSQRKQAD